MGAGLSSAWVPAWVSAWVPACLRHGCRLGCRHGCRLVFGMGAETPRGSRVFATETDQIGTKQHADTRPTRDRIAQSRPNRDPIGTKRQEEVAQSRPNQHETTRRNRPTRDQIDRIATQSARNDAPKSTESTESGDPPPPFFGWRAVLDPRSLNFFALHCAFLQKSCKSVGG